MAVLSIKSLFLWLSNILLPFVIYLNLQNTVKDDVRAKVELFTSNAGLLYFVLLAGWTIFNLLNLWIKYQKEYEYLKKARIERELKELELKNKKDETTET
jgi:type III secretory pathway component EscU